MSPLDDEPKDWEIQDEEPPERLRRKWESEEGAERKIIHCPSCRKPVPADAFKCHFCGVQIFHNSGLLGRILKWFKGL